MARRNISTEDQPVTNHRPRFAEVSSRFPIGTNIRRLGDLLDETSRLKVAVVSEVVISAHHNQVLLKHGNYYLDPDRYEVMEATK